MVDWSTATDSDRSLYDNITVPYFRLDIYIGKHSFHKAYKLERMGNKHVFVNVKHLFVCTTIFVVFNTNVKLGKMEQ